MSMNCLVGSPFDNSVPSKVTPLEYWYAIEASSDDVESFRYDLESAIYHTAIKNVVWCTQGGNRRMEDATEGEYYVDDYGRRLGVMAISSAPIDELQTDSPCTQDLRTEGDSCFLFKGVMSIMSHENDNVSMPASYIRKGIQQAMDSDALLGSSSGRADSLSVITRVVYLGETDPTLADKTENDETETGNPFEPPVVSDGIKSIAGTDNSDQGDDKYAPIMVSSFVGAALVMLLGIFLVKRRRNRSVETLVEEVKPPPMADDDDATFGDDTVVSYHEDEDNYVTSPPPPSEDDIRAQALEAERQYAMEKGLGTIPEDRTYHSDMNTIEMLIPADASHLGSCHSTMDVQPCQSSTCNQCRNESVVFISRDWQPDLTPSEDGDADSSLSSDRTTQGQVEWRKF